ncbi:MAG TPA: hypothetical protein VLI90_08735 [Tepidisphaeraceae bacterium]|nr:hypothetical protein [Tepidisphaeraceae bacterium]
MRVILICVLLVMSTMALAQPAPPLINPVGAGADSATLRPDAGMDEVLEALHERGQNLKEFVADVTLIDNDLIMSTQTTRTGKVWAQFKPGGDARLHARFDKRIEEGKPPQNDLKEYSLDDGWLVDRDYRAKNEVRRQVAAPGEKVNLFQLGKGPFPLPIGQEVKSVHEQFDVTKVEPAKDDPPGAIHLQLTPKEKTDLARKFQVIDVWVDPATRMPVRIKTIDHNQTTERQTDFTNVKVNPTPGLTDADFKLPPIDQSGWQRHEEALH